MTENIRPEVMKSLKELLEKDARRIVDTNPQGYAPQVNLATDKNGKYIDPRALLFLSTGYEKK